MTAEMQDGLRDALLEQLVKSARRRWAVLAVGLALLALLFIFAGLIRTPGARKNPYTVVASRVLAVVGAVLLTRIVLLTHEDGVPVFLIETAGGSGESLAEALDLIENRFEVVPLSDVVAFVRDQRYVPRKGVALVLEVKSRADMSAAVRVLSRSGRPAGLAATLLLAEPAAAAALPESASLAVEARGGDERTVTEALKSVSLGVEKAAGLAPAYAMLDDDRGLTLGKISRVAGIEAFFGGDGLNRYGDRGHRIRLMNITRILAAGKARGTRLWVYTRMYRGDYTPYPIWAWLDKADPLPEVRP
jgi:hypothetical protein